MDQFVIETFKTPAQLIYEAISSEINAPEYVKHLRVSENKDGSISVKAKNVMAMKVKLQKEPFYVEIRPKNAGFFSGSIVVAHNDEWSRISISGVDDVLGLKTQISSLYMRMLSEFGGESFGCCHRYVQCSDARKCIHPNLVLAFGCGYRKNLEAGRIFYGKNKNI